VSIERIYEVKKQWLPVYVVLLIVAILVSIHLALMYQYTKEDNYAVYTLLSLLFAGYMGYGIAKLFRVKIPKYKYVKVVQCESCGHSENGVMEKGDYLYREAGTCPKCGGRMLVVALYREEVK